MKKLVFVAMATIVLSSCVPAVVRQGEVGVKRKAGVLSQKTLDPGMYFYNPVITRIIKLPYRTVNLELILNLPSMEGLTIQSEVSILYNLTIDRVPYIVENIGENYETDFILNVFRSAAADVCAQFLAKDMHSGERSNIEARIADRMMEIMGHRGFTIEAVLLKSIRLPADLSRAIEDKLRADQQAQMMEFVLQRERREAERLMIEAEAIRDAQKVISEGLNRDVIEWRGIEALRELSASPNAKMIITDGKTPFILGGERP